MECKKTVLFDEHLLLGGKIVEFAGYLLPIEYSQLAIEHKIVREDVGVFDVSHMGEIRIRGVDASKFVNYLITNNVVKSKNNRMVYGLLLTPSGEVVDDLMCYKYNEDNILIVCNASNIDKDYQYIISNKSDFDVTISNESEETNQLALQGPNAINIIKGLTNDQRLTDMKLFDFLDLKLMNRQFLVSRSGYTGSDGFEIYGSKDDIILLFKEFIKMGVAPCGLGCRDTLRFEAAMPLYGHEISDSINPLEACLSFAIDFSKDFIGKDSLLKIKEAGIGRKLVGLELLDKGIARSEYEVFKDGVKIGYVTTGYMIPNTANCYALALIDSKYSNLGEILEIKIRKNFVKCVVRDKKFMNKHYVR